MLCCGKKDRLGVCFAVMGDGPGGWRGSPESLSEMGEVCTKMMGSQRHTRGAVACDKGQEREDGVMPAVKGEGKEDEVLGED